MSERALDVVGLSGGYPGLTIFRNLSLTLPVGQIVGICGPNGAGKTTLLKTLAGLLPVLLGRVLLGSNDITATKAYERARLGVALVPEGRLIFNSLSVRQNSELCRAAGRLDKSAFPQRFEEVLSLFPRLRERLDQSGGSLSGGEQQMLAIGRALLLDPTVLMLDEPTQGLAPIMVRQVLTALHGLRGKLSMIVVEQNRGFLGELVDVTYDMRGGAIFAR